MIKSKLFPENKYFKSIAVSTNNKGNSKLSDINDDNVLYTETYSTNGSNINGFKPLNKDTLAFIQPDVIEESQLRSSVIEK